MAVSGRKAREVQSAVGSTVVRRCGPCEIEAELVDAHGYCVECTDYLCKDCYRSHRRSRASKHHKLLTNDELSTTEVDHSSSNTCTETCNKHKTEIIKFFCPSHNILGCSDCITLGHRTCRLEYIPDESVGFSDSAEYKDTERALEKKLGEMNLAMKKVNVIEGIIENVHEQCLKDIDSFQTQIINHINKLRNKITMQVDDKKKTNKEYSDRVKSTINTMTSELKQVETDVQRSKAAKQDSQLFIGTKRAQAVLQSHSMRTRELCITAGKMMYQFERDQGLHEVLKESDTFGKLQNLECLEAFDFRKAQDVRGELNVGGVNVVPIQLLVTNGIIVTNIPEDVSHDAVRMYFENAGQSQGGEAVNVEVNNDGGYCLVVFKDAKVVFRVCQKKDHKLHGQHVDVQPYNEYLGLSVAVEGLTFKLPNPITLENQDPYKMKFLKANASQRSTLEQELAKCKAKIFWDDDPISIECTLTKDDKVSRGLLKTWTNDALECLTQFIDVLTVKKASVDTNIWSEIRKEVDGLQLTHPDGVALIIERENKRIVLVAHKGLAESVWQDILAAVEVAQRKRKEKKESTTEDKELAEWKIAYLRAAHFEEDMLSEHNNLKMRFEERQGKGRIYLTGPKQTVHTVWIEMFERIQNIKNRELELEKEQIELLQNERTIEKVKQSMKRKHVPDVLEVKPNAVILHADEEDDLSKMETAINKTLAKLSINLDSGTEGILKSGKWKTTEKSLKKKFSGCVVISVNTNQLDIFTLSDIQDQVSDELRSFFPRMPYTR